MKRIDIKELLIEFRNGMAFSFSWLVLCTMILAAMYGRDSISVGTLLKIFVLCVWAVLCFIVCFGNALIKKKGFIFRLTLFYGLFIPVEVIMFFFMHIFTMPGKLLEWGVFAALIVSFYVVCVLINNIVCKKQGVIYTEQLKAYNERRTHEQHNKDNGTGNSKQST